MFASQVKMQKDIVDLIEQRLVSFVTLPSFLSEICRNAIPPFFKLACHANIIIKACISTLTFQFVTRQKLLFDNLQAASLMILLQFVFPLLQASAIGSFFEESCVRCFFYLNRAIYLLVCLRLIV